MNGSRKSQFLGCGAIHGWTQETIIVQRQFYKQIFYDNFYFSKTVN